MALLYPILTRTIFRTFVFDLWAKLDLNLPKDNFSKERKMDTTSHDNTVDSTETQENEEFVWPGDVKKEYHEVQTEETFTFQLNDTEKAEKAMRLVEVEGQLDSKRKHLKELQKEIKDEIKELDAIRLSHLKAIEEGEDRFIPCLKRVYQNKDTVEFLSLDGKEVLKERHIEPEDKQLRLVEGSMVEHSDDTKDEINYDENHKRAKEAEEAALDDAGEELEKITDRTLRDNTPSF